METVAQEAGVSRATVSLVYRGVKGPSQASIERVLAAGERLGYRHNAIAARLAAKRTDTLGLFVLDLSNEVFTEIFEGVREGLADSELSLVLAAGSPGAAAEHAQELKAVESLLDVRVDAAIVAGSMLEDAELASLAASAPFVVVSRLVPGVDSVATDDRLGGALATRHLLELGHRSIAHLAPPSGSYYRARRDGYRHAMRAAGLAPREIDTGFSIAAATATAVELLRVADRPTAVFADNDVAALGVLSAAAELGIRVPEQLSIVGYDNTQAAALPGVALTSVDQQARRLGRIGAEYALEALGVPGGTGAPEAESARAARSAAPKQTLLEPSLRVRASTAAAAS